MKMTTHRAVPTDGTGSKAAWFALGLLGGAAVALLVSPTSGRENRRLVRRGARQVSDYITDEGGVFATTQRRLVNQVVERGREEAQAIGARVNDAIAHGKTAYRAAREQFNGVAAEATDAVNAARDDVDRRLS